MALDKTLWRINLDKSIDYIGGGHGSATANYVTVLELHRFLQDQADEASVVDDDFMDITTDNPSDKAFDTIINLVNGYYLSEASATPAVEFVYGGSIIQNPGGGEQIYDGVRVVANAGCTTNVIQNNAVLTNAFWNNIPDGRKTTQTATVTGVNAISQNILNVSDSSEFTAGDYIVIGTVVDESYQVDEVVDGTTLRLTTNLLTATTGGEAIAIGFRGINPDAANGVASQFMVKVRDTGADIDNTALLFNTREWYKTFAEFRIPATGRGVNVVPLQYVDDLNNQTPANTVSGWSGDINNTSVGWNQIDMQDGGGLQDYYSAWDFNKPTRSINDVYEYFKYITFAGTTTTAETYSLEGQLFRGITHEIDLTAAASPGDFTEGDSTDLTWGTGATAGVGRIMAYETGSSKVYIQLLSGVIPGDSETLTQGANSATTLASDAVTERPISTPFGGASTGSAIVGAYGLGIVYADVTTNDLFTSLDGNTRKPPNNVTFSVNGVQSGWTLIVGPDSSGLDKSQLTIAAQTGASVSTLDIGTVPDNTPATGTIRISRADGRYTRHTYENAASGTTNDITLNPAVDFSGNNSGTTAFISYIDRVCTGTTENFNTVQTSTQTLYIETRFGGTGPGYTDAIKPTPTTGTLNAGGGSATLSPVSDA